MRVVDADAIITQLMERRKRYIKWLDEFRKQGREHESIAYELNKQLFEVNCAILIVENSPAIN